MTLSYADPKILISKQIFTTAFFKSNPDLTGANEQSMCWNRPRISGTNVVTGLILGLRAPNERRRYFVTTSLIGWAQTYKRWRWRCKSSGWMAIHLLNWDKNGRLWEIHTSTKKTLIIYLSPVINTTRQEHNGRHFADNILKYILF